MRFRLRLPLFLLVLFLTIFPQLLLATQVFKLISLLHLTNTGPGVILSWVAYFAPFGTYIMTTYFADMPYELVEAARIDGASQLRILVSVMTPLAAPMIATIAIIGFQSMWNELPFSLLILQDQGSRTLTLGIAMMRGEYGLRVPDPERGAWSSPWRCPSSSSSFSSNASRSAPRRARSRADRYRLTTS